MVAHWFLLWDLPQECFLWSRGSSPEFKRGVVRCRTPRLPGGVRSNIAQYITMRYFATTPKGLEPILEQELLALGAESTRQARGGVHFEGSFALAVEANVWLRSAMRILEPVAEEQPAQSAD